MIFITEHSTIPKLKIWHDVKGYDSFKNSLESYNGQVGLLSYYHVLDDTKELFKWDSWEIDGDFLVLYEKIHVNSTEQHISRWIHMDDACIQECYTAQEQADIQHNKTNYANYLEIEDGIADVPSGYKVVPVKTVDKATVIEQMVEVQRVKVRKL